MHRWSHGNGAVSDEPGMRERFPPLPRLGAATPTPVFTEVGYSVSANSMLTGQWSEPMTSAWMLAAFSLPFSAPDTSM